jgi:hypothetical protein
LCSTHIVSVNLHEGINNKIMNPTQLRTNNIHAGQYNILRSWDRASLIYSSLTNKIQRYTIVFITINALHVSGDSSAHHQELKTV